MRGRTPALIAVLMATAVTMILISPAVPSPPTPDPTKHTLQPPRGVLHSAAIALISAANESWIMQGFTAERPARTTINGSVLDVTTALRC
jgi:hypothetical protein